MLYIIWYFLFKTGLPMTLKTVDRNCLSFEEKDETFVKHIYDKLTYCNFNFL